MNDLETPLRNLPHGPEFRFLDRLTSLTAGACGAGEYRLRGDEPFLQGHFPGRPLFPGVLLIEACAQLAGVVAQCDPAIPPLPDLRLTAVRAAKILGSATPGEVVRLEAKILGRLGNLIQAETRAYAGERLLLEGQLTLGGNSPG